MVFQQVIRAASPPRSTTDANTRLYLVRKAIISSPKCSLIQRSVRNWKDPLYLSTGNRRQQLAYAALQNLGIWRTLSAFDPVLAGTIPLAIDIASSDLDILCAVDSAETARFTQLLRAQYAHLPEFTVARKLINHHASVVCTFRYQGYLQSSGK